MTAAHYIAETGSRIAAEFKARQYDVEEFAEIAANAMREDPPIAQVGITDIAELVALDSLPIQGDPHSKFGQPSITLYWHPRFRIDALFWRTPHIAIHQHQFSGAFTPLVGESLQSRFAFRETERVSASMSFGAVEFQGARLLKAGDVEPIELGSALIHSVTHLRAMAVSIVVRTHRHPLSGAQYQYERPGIARDGDAVSSTAKQLQMLRCLLAEEPTGCTRWVIAAVSASELAGTYDLLGELYRSRRMAPSAWLLARAEAERRFGARIAHYELAFEETERQLALTQMRRRLSDSGERLFLALLATVPSRAGMNSVLCSAFPEVDPAVQLSGWLCDVGVTDEPGTWSRRDREVAREIVAALLSGESIDGVAPLVGPEVVGRFREETLLPYLVIALSSP